MEQCRKSKWVLVVTYEYEFTHVHTKTAQNKDHATTGRTPESGIPKVTIFSQ